MAARLAAGNAPADMAVIISFDRSIKDDWCSNLLRNSH
jgi:hypothetical protein